MKDVMEYDDNTVWLDRTAHQIRNDKNDILGLWPGYTGFIQSGGVDASGFPRHYRLNLYAIEKSRPFLHDPQNLFILEIDGTAFNTRDVKIRAWGNAQYLAEFVSLNMHKTIVFFER